MNNSMDKLTKAEQYAEDVRNKRILTCELVQLAVKRYYNEMRWTKDGTSIGRQR